MKGGGVGDTGHTSKKYKKVVFGEGWGEKKDDLNMIKLWAGM